MMNQVKISIIMPVYNDGDTIEESLNSVMNQTLDDIEIICVNDGSTDNSLEILKNYQSKYGDMIKIFNQENMGSGIARNNAMKYAIGEYIAFLDSDDIFIDKNALKKMYDVAIKNNADMVSANLKVIDTDGKLIINNNLPRFVEEEVIMPEDYGIPYSFYKNIFKRSFLIDHNFEFPDLLRGQDPVFFAEILVSLNEIYTVPIEFYALRSAGNNFGKINTYRKKHDYIDHFRQVFDILKRANFNSLVDQYKQQLFYYFKSPELSSSDKDQIKKIVHDVFNYDSLILNACDSFFSDVKVSLIIPVYNAENFLDESINSLLNQSLKDIELVCVNDGSKDNSLSMLRKFQERDDRVKIIDQENGGCGAARNKALDNATGDYIYFFDPDDYLVPNALEELYNNAVSNDSDFVIFKIASFRDGEPINYNEPGFEFEKIFNNIDFNNFTFNYRAIKRHVLLSSFAPWTKFYKKDFLEKYDDFRFNTNVAFDDVPFHVKSMLRASRISYVPDFFYHYRLSNPNSVNNTSSNAPDIFKIVGYVEDFLKKNNFFDEFREDFIIFKITQLSMYIISSNSEEYFNDVKKDCIDLNFYNTDAFEGVMKRNNALKRYDAIVNSNSISEYKNYIQGSNKKVPNKIISDKDIPNNMNGPYFDVLDDLKDDIGSLNIFANNLKRFILEENPNLNVEEIFSSNISDCSYGNHIQKYDNYSENALSEHNSYKINVLADKNRYLSNQNIQLKNRGKNISIKKLFKR